MHDPVCKAHRQVWRDGSLAAGTRLIPEETALALTYNGGTYAVMMGTAQDLRDFAVGFSLGEGIVQSLDEIDSLDVVELDDGIELRMWLAPSRAAAINQRRRHIAGPTGCGICGIDSIAEAIRPAAIVPTGRSFLPREIMTAIASIAPVGCPRSAIAAPLTPAIRRSASSLSTPAQCKAVISPRLCPRAALAEMPSSSNTFKPASDAATTAGCITRVETSSTFSGKSVC